MRTAPLALATAFIVVVAGVVIIESTDPAAAVDAAGCLIPEGQPWTLDQDQRRQAQLIITVGRQRAVPPRGWAIAVATAAQESSLRNPTAPDEFGSSGLFQQTPPWWGTRAQVNDPFHAAGSFYTALLRVTGWPTMPLTVAAQAVQASSFPDAYRKHTATAVNAVRELGGVELDCARITTDQAEPAPRNPDGSWPAEGCTIRPDPTSGQGCLTPRTLHLVGQARAADYPEPNNCWRGGSRGEHPKGRACDWMMTAGGEATGAQKARGDARAAWAVANADRLAISYVIWFRRIWTRAEGWHDYTNPWGGNDAYGWHTNHIHISVY